MVLAVSGALAQHADFDWQIPPPFPRLQVLRDNRTNAAKVELGRHLFYDARLSVNGRQSCATCHRQELAFADGRAVAVGTTGEVHPRGSMNLANVAYAPALTWANPTLQSLESQALIPMLGTHPIELGLAGEEVTLLLSVRLDLPRKNGRVRDKDYTACRNCAS